ncbi:hypothetical protein HDU76_010068 [Blyttiomyces sp. JEL0837]|nr:hypothetical protein HDU76_010068 [Blyttiomyces sp. JEL0837]
MRVPDNTVRPPSSCIHPDSQRRHFNDTESNELESKLLKEDLSPHTNISTTYAKDFSLSFHSEPRTERYVRAPRMDFNDAETDKKVKVEVSNIPSRAEVDKFLYVSLYQASYQGTQSNGSYKYPGKSAQTIHKDTTASLYQDTYANPRLMTDEMKLLDNKSNRTGRYRDEYAKRNAGVSKLLHLVEEPFPTTSYNNDYKHSIPIVEAGAPPSYAEFSHPLQTRQIVKKAFKYRKH